MIAMLGACGHPQKDTGLGTEPEQVRFVADWDDLVAAADLAAERTELAIVSSSDPSGRSCMREFILRGVSGETATLVVERPEPCTESQAQPLTVSIRIGRFGEPAREARFIREFRERLEALCGRDYAPIR
jgi:hypothetical protein